MRLLYNVVHNLYYNTATRVHYNVGWPLRADTILRSRIKSKETKLFPRDGLKRRLSISLVEIRVCKGISSPGTACARACNLRESQ